MGFPGQSGAIGLAGIYQLEAQLVKERLHIVRNRPFVRSRSGLCRIVRGSFSLALTHSRLSLIQQATHGRVLGRLSMGDIGLHFLLYRSGLGCLHRSGRLGSGLGSGLGFLYRDGILIIVTVSELLPDSQELTGSFRTGRLINLRHNIRIKECQMVVPVEVGTEHDHTRHRDSRVKDNLRQEHARRDLNITD